MEIILKNSIIRSFKIDDAPSLAYFANNKNIWLQVRDAFPHPYSDKDAELFIETTLKQKPECAFAITVNTRAVGVIGLHLQNDIERFSAEIGYWLGEEYWGRGVLTEALKAVTEFGFEEFNLNRVFALPFARNVGSVLVLEKTGFNMEGRLIKSAFKDGQFEDQFLYAYLKGESLEDEK
jgi:ribosomal-protein-alanine N-acetyltransferase